MFRTGLAALAALSSFQFAHSETLPKMDNHRYDVVWETPSKDASGSMPIGNGEVVLNVWVEEATGDLLFYIGRSDSLSEISRILKLGKIRVHIDGSPFKGASDFKQHLSIHDGTMTIIGGGSRLELFVDSGSDTIFISGNLGRSAQVSVTNEPWRTAPHTLKGEETSSAWSANGGPFPLTESADQLKRVDDHRILWFHRNETSVVPTLWDNQTLRGLPGTHDPVIHRTFGGIIESEELTGSSSYSLTSSEPLKTFSVKIATASRQTESVDAWQALVAKEAESTSYQSAKSRTESFWHKFWDRSWFDCSDPEVGRGYNLQRYVQACQGRGTYPYKFNGGTYTVEPTAMKKPFNADWRAWGDAQWYQNLRHMQHPMVAAGDFDMMEPFFRLYETNRKLAESRDKLYHNATGAYFPETMTMFGTYAGNDYGWNRKGLTPDQVQCPWWQYAWNQGLELVALMLDRWDYTRDEAFLKKRVIPMAESVLSYFDTRFKKDAQGRIVLDPTQSAETYWYEVVNDMPSTAGLIAITERLNALPKHLVTSDQKSFFDKMSKSCPELPFQTKNGERELAPAQKYKPETSNVENTEQYAVWPFRLVCLQSPQFLEEGKVAYKNRLFKQDTGWGYDGNVAALLGLTEEAARILKVKCQNSNKAYRWPATWGPNFDWLPDQNHGGNLLETTDLMLIQGDSMEKGGKILLLPSWPKTWDVSFKLHAPGNTTVQCRAEGGRVVELAVSPASRKKDIVLGAGWTQ